VPNDFNALGFRDPLAVDRSQLELATRFIEVDDLVVLA
jgi:hypothetical protein